MKKMKHVNKAVKRFEMRLPEEIHTELKELSSKYNLTIASLIMSLIVNLLEYERSLK